MMQRSDFDKWLEAMKSEMEFMKINNVWILVDPPEGIKSIGCKWIFKKKKGADGRWRPIKSIRLPRVTVSIMVLTMTRRFLL